MHVVLAVIYWATMYMCSSPFLWIHCVLALVMLVMAVGFMAHFSNNILLEYDEEVLYFLLFMLIY